MGLQIFRLVVDAGELTVRVGVTEDDLDGGTVVNSDFQADIIRQAFPNAEEVQ